jgi:hypothetical protein
MKVDHGTVRSLDNLCQRSRMVIVAVAQDDGVEPVQGNAEYRGVVVKRLSLARVEQHPAIIGFHEKRQTMLGKEPLAVDQVVDDGCDPEAPDHRAFR